MLPLTMWSERCHRSAVKPTFTEMGWKNLMSECLTGTEIYRKKENEIQECLRLDPNLVMDMRHRMAREYPKQIPVSQVQIHAEALKLSREKNHERLLKQKEVKMVEKEVARLKQSLENHRLSVQKNLDEITKKRTSPLKFIKNYTKLSKKIESFDGCYEIDAWFGRAVEIMMETKINDRGISTDVKVTFQKQENTKMSLNSDCTQIKILNEHDAEDEDKGKNEIMKRFLEKTAKEMKKSTLQNEQTKAARVEEKINQKRNERACGARRVYAKRLKTRKKEVGARKSKIETFLSKLKEKDQPEQSSQLKTNLYENRAQIRQKQNEKLEKLMQEVKASKMEAYRKLQEIPKPQTNQNPKFLQMMEERWEERLKRKRELEEKKRKIKEEAEKAKREIEEEKKLEEEEKKRRSLEEIKNKRRLEKEKKLRKERQREKFRIDMTRAANHYKLYLLRSYGLRPWTKLMQLQDSQQKRAAAHFNKKLTQKVFRHWLVDVREQLKLKHKCADEFCDKMLKKNSLSVWMEFYWERIKQDQAAMDWNDFRLTEKAFRKWLEFMQEEQMLYLNRIEKARFYYERKLKAKYLKNLQDYPEWKRLARAKENRKRMWRQKIRKIIPDYKPVDVCKDF